MVELIDTTNYLLALGTIALQAVIVVLLVDYFLWRGKYFGRLISQYAYPVVFLLALFGSILTLVYSEIFGFIPCGLCWLQRVALYPLVVIFGIASFSKKLKGDHGAALYGIVLSILGAIVALYQHYLQMGGSEFVACPVAGAGADCAKRYVFEFGYITFPMMSLTLFVLIVVILYIHKSKTS